MLSLTARGFDLLGLVTPITIKIREFMESKWHFQLYWNVPILENLRHEWNLVIQDTVNSLKIKFPRQFLASGMISYLLHASADDGTTGFGSTLDIAREKESLLLLARPRVAFFQGFTISKIGLFCWQHIL